MSDPHCRSVALIKKFKTGIEMMAINERCDKPEKKTNNMKTTSLTAVVQVDEMTYSTSYSIPVPPRRLRHATTRA